MRAAQTLVPAAILLLSACRPPQVAWNPRGPLQLEVRVENLPEDFREELEGRLRAAFETGGTAVGSAANRLVVHVTELRPDPRSSFWKTWGITTAGGTLQGGAYGSGAGAVLGLAFGIVMGPIVYAQHAEIERTAGYRPFVVRGELRAGAVASPEIEVPEVLDLMVLDIRPHLPALPAEEAKDPGRIRRATAQALAEAIRAELRKRGVP